MEYDWEEPVEFRKDGKLYEPQRRKAKRWYRKKHPDWLVYAAYYWGGCSPKRKNPFPAGYRHDAFVDGQRHGAGFYKDLL